MPTTAARTVWTRAESEEFEPVSKDFKVRFKLPIFHQQSVKGSKEMRGGNIGNGKGKGRETSDVEAPHGRELAAAVPPNPSLAVPSTQRRRL